MLEKIERIRAMKAAGRKVAVLTAYDYPLARLLDESGVDIILVGDSLGMVVLGFPDTTSVTMEHMVHHCAAVCRGVKEALVVADMPIGSCDTPEAAVANSRRLIEAGADAVKIEGPRSAEIRAIVQAGIPLMAHLGMLPQRVREEGGYHIKGKTAEEAAGAARSGADRRGRWRILRGARIGPARRCRRYFGGGEHSHHRHRLRPGVRRPGARDA